jgi:DNA-binding NarL/FixJ family response regulator
LAEPLFSCAIVAGGGLLLTSFSAMAEARRTKPDVALIDIRMPVLDGIETTRRITSELPETKVLVLTTFGTEENVFEALSAGASGFLLKDIRPEQLVEAVEAVAWGEGRLDPAVTSAVVQHFRGHTAGGKWLGV